jgi:hypothetical protein
MPFHEVLEAISVQIKKFEISPQFKLISSTKEINLNLESLNLANTYSNPIMEDIDPESMPNKYYLHQNN